MNNRNPPSLHSFTPGFGGPGGAPLGGPGGAPFGGGPGGSPFPGLGDPFGGPPAAFNPVEVVNPGGQPAAGAAKGLGAFANLNEIKGIIDRMGGIDGILSGMTKIQKIVSTMQQMAPLFKLFAKGAAKAGTASSNTAARPRRRTRRRRSVGSGRPSYGRRTGNYTRRRR
ncbi:MULTISPECIES: aminotransferase [Cohnella]|jgi:SLT domain-containing protein|uniref:aminotransferase n=1 Tax=Cohnella TaxID=329857 RepID=UPI00257AB63B|nr:aminotransferase [Cohnella sp.]